MRMHRIKGFTLIELLVTIMLTSTFGLTVAAGYQLISAMNTRLSSKEISEDEIANANQHIQFVGQHSMNCRIPASAYILSSTTPQYYLPAREIRCRADISGSPTAGAQTEMRFVWNSVQRTLDFQSSTAPGACTFNTRISYRFIENFGVCDDEIIRRNSQIINSGVIPPTNDPNYQNWVGIFACLFPGKAVTMAYDRKQDVTQLADSTRLSDSHVANLDPSRGDLRVQPNRFFRFFISGQFYNQTDSEREKSRKLGALMRPVTFQNAFYVRNPTPLSLGNALYTWTARGNQ